MASRNGQLDTSIQIITPENIAFQYRVAGPFRRLPAYLLDFVIRGVVFGVVALVSVIVTSLAGIPNVGVGVAFITWFVLSWFYGGLFETFWNGQTPGKRALKIRVLSIDGQPVTGLQAVLRNVLRAIDSQPLVFYLVGLLAAMMNGRFQRLGDLACGTMVVVEEPKWYFGVIRMADPAVIQMAERLPSGFEPSPSLGRALAAYVQRRGHFSWERRVEIARHLADPLRERLGLPRETNPDLLLCAMYYRTFITDRRGDAVAAPSSPFGTPRQVAGAGV
jgi:uncharacterized RDD family membrane protein YckC